MCINELINLIERELGELGEVIWDGKTLAKGDLPTSLQSVVWNSSRNGLLIT